MAQSRAYAHLAFLLAFSAIAISAAPVSAAGDNANGHALADRLCTACHIVSDQSNGATVSADVPSFRAIAKRAEQSAERIAGRIVVPHPPMPQIQLTRQEIADLAAYIMSLNSD